MADPLSLVDPKPLVLPEPDPLVSGVEVEPTWLPWLELLVELVTLVGITDELPDFGVVLDDPPLPA